MKFENCLECGNKIGKYGKKFCSCRCSAFYNNRNSEKLKSVKRGPAPVIKRMRYKNCLYCGTILKKSARKYCNNKCKTEFERKIKMRNWLSGIDDGSQKSGFSKVLRECLIEKNNHACSRCGWDEINQFTNKSPLEIDHIDGNAYNNRPENIIILCPNCHSLTKYHKGANRGNGRQEYLKKYYMRNSKGKIL